MSESTEGDEERPTALVTGASRGIGRAIALRLAAEYDVVAVARSEEELDTLADDVGALGGSCHSLVLDVTDGAAVRAALADLEVDVVINNAGVGNMKPFLDLSWEEWKQTVDVNVNALYHVTHAVLPGMVKRGNGHVITIGSIAGRSAFKNGTCYGGTKHFVAGWAESLMLEVRDAGVRVSVVNPGSVATSFFTDDRDSSWMLQPEDVAETVAHVLSAPPHALVHSVEVRASMPKK